MWACRRCQLEENTVVVQQREVQRCYVRQPLRGRGFRNYIPRDVLDDLYHVPTHGARHSLTYSEPLQMHTNVGAGCRVWGRACAGGNQTDRWMVLEEDNEIFRQV